MKKTVCILTTVLGLSLAVAGGPGKVDPIAAIRAEYSAVKKALPKLKCTTKSVDGISTDGAEAKAYRDSKGKIRFLAMAIYSESWRGAEEYCFKDGKLIFAFTRDTRYNVPYYIDAAGAKETGGEAFDPKKSKVIENRFYFENDRLVRWQKNKTVVKDLGSKAAREAASGARDTAKERLKLF
jgi:hypothetical protein